jgi:putative SOS response-associated peptidase YedK
MCSVKAQTELKFKNRKKSKIASKTLEQKIIKDSTAFTKNYNIWIGMKGYVITDSEPEYYQAMVFGLTPSWSDKKLFLFNARAEGKYNPTNNPDYTDVKGIFEMPSFRNSIKSKRCIVPVDYPYLIRRKDHEALIFAGIWDEWLDKNTGELIKSYAIITTAASKLLQGIHHHRSPLKLDDEQIDAWLNPSTNMDELNSLLYPHDYSECDAIPIEPFFKSKQNHPDVIRLRNAMF